MLIVSRYLALWQSDECSRLKSILHLLQLVQAKGVLDPHQVTKIRVDKVNRGSIASRFTACQFAH